MTPAERARQIDQEEFRRDSEQALLRALEYSRQKQRERRARVLGIKIRNVVITEKEKRPFAEGLVKNYSANGKTLSAEQWASKLGITVSTFLKRVNEFGLEQTVAGAKRSRGTKPLKLYTYQGQSRPLREWAADLGIAESTLANRVYKLGTLEAAIHFNAGRRRTPANDNAPGVSSDFAPFEGTGAGAVLQETPNITFSDKAENA
jgi:hypothetical protein